MRALLLLLSLCAGARADEVIIKLAGPDARPLQRWLRQRGVTRIRPLKLIHAVAATVSPRTARELRQLPGVIEVTPDRVLHLPPRRAGSGFAPGGNLLEARRLWSRGFDGSGVVVANLDSGVDLAHPDLRDRWAGEWWDPHQNSPTPYDLIGHGTQTMGIMVGGSAIGVAPGARWIAAKIYDDSGNTTVSLIHEAFEWLLELPEPPRVVNASWELGAVNECDTTFEDDLAALRAAGILVVLAAGNSGPRSYTSLSPANNEGGFSIGAVDARGTVADFSSRGASSCTNRIFPDLVAPGVDVLTTDRSLGGQGQYTYVTGTSFAAPNVAGAAALLFGAFPSASPATIERLLRAGARNLGPAGPDDDYGYGRVDAWAAYWSGLTPATLRTRYPDDKKARD